jgi:hypothetical protein
MKCLSCGDIVESVFIHQFVTCKCGKVSVDGGIAVGNRVLGNPNDMEDCSEWKTEGPENRKYLPKHVIYERHEQIKKSLQRKPF